MGAKCLYWWKMVERAFSENCILKRIIEIVRNDIDMPIWCLLEEDEIGVTWSSNIIPTSNSPNAKCLEMRN